MPMTKRVAPIPSLERLLNTSFHLFSIGNTIIPDIFRIFAAHKSLGRSRRDSLAALEQAAFFTMNWIILILAGLCEVGFTYCLGRVKGVIGTEWWMWITGFAALYVLSAVLLAKATQTIPIGTAYPVWTGIGAVGAVVVGIFIFREPATFWRIFFLTTLIASIIGLKTLS